METVRRIGTPFKLGLFGLMAIGCSGTDPQVAPREVGGTTYAGQSSPSGGMVGTYTESATGGAFGSSGGNAGANGSFTGGAFAHSGGNSGAHTSGNVTGGAFANSGGNAGGLHATGGVAQGGQRATGGAGGTSGTNTDGKIQPGPTYQVKGRNLYDPCGEKVVVRGVEQMFWDTSWISSSFVSEIAKTGANTVRVLPQITAPTPDGAGTESLAETERLIQLAIKNQMLVDIAIDGGKNVDVYLRNDVKTLLLKYESQIVIHAKGESDEPSEDAWAAVSKTAVSQLRAAGYKAPIYILPTGYGRMLTDILHKGEEIMAADPLKNIVFGWQAYWGNSGYWQGMNGMTLSEAMAKVRDAPFPIQMGIMWHTDAGIDPSEAMDYSFAMAQAQSYGIGWLWWDWRMSTDNLTTDGTYGHWADAGLEVVSRNANSIAKTSTRTYFQQNGACRSDTTLPDAATSDYPTPATTGVPPGTVLADVTLNNTDQDSYWVTDPGAVIDSKHIPGHLLIRANDVVVKNSQIDGTVYNDFDDVMYRYTITDSTIGVEGGCITQPGLNYANYGRLESESRGTTMAFGSPLPAMSPLPILS